MVVSETVTRQKMNQLLNFHRSLKTNSSVKSQWARIQHSQFSKLTKFWLGVHQKMVNWVFQWPTVRTMTFQKK
jgi:hypothetical protein